MNSLLLDQICYELVMSVGESLTLSNMLKKALTTYMRRLNCRAGLVLRADRSEDGRLWFGPVYGVPRLMSRNKALQEVMAQLPEGVSGPDADTFYASLPIMGRANGASYHIMPLPDFGLLVLIKSGDPFDSQVLNALGRVNAKLATSCVSCSKAEEAESSARALRRKVEEHRIAEDRFRRIFEGAAEGIIQTTWEGRLRQANPAMAAILGYDTPEHMLMQTDRLVETVYENKADRDRFRAKLVEQGTVTGFETRFVRRDGTLVWVSLSARIVCDEHGNAEFIEAMVEDVSQRMQAQLELQRAKDEAEQLSQMKSNFLSMVSHELRTPLTSILGFAKILLRQMGDCENRCTEKSDTQGQRLISRMRDNLNIISAESGRLTDLINNVLDLSRLESGRFEWHDVDVDMNEVLDHSLGVTDVLFKSKGIDLVQHIHPGLPHVRADRDRLIQVCVNLLSNAAKFTEHGVVTCRAWCENGMTVVEVEDTGMGIRNEDKEIIFDKFRQLGDTLTDKPRGSGLGLPICKEIVEHYGGKLGVRAAPGGGSIFWFTVPMGC